MTEIPEYLLQRAQKALDKIIMENPIPVNPTEETVSAKTAVVIPTSSEPIEVTPTYLHGSELTRDQRIRAIALQYAQTFYVEESTDPDIICDVILPIAKSFEEYIRGY